MSVREQLEQAAQIVLDVVGRDAEVPEIRSELHRAFQALDPDVHGREMHELVSAAISLRSLELMRWRSVAGSMVRDWLEHDLSSVSPQRFQENDAAMWFEAPPGEGD